jgi:hypothetical protein
VLLKAIGKDGSDLYDEWKAYLKQDYKDKVAGIKQLQVEGKIIADVGFATLPPIFA